MSSIPTDMAAHAHRPWTHVFGAERFVAYKPHPLVYTSACKEFGLEPGQCAMVVAHLEDLETARKCGLQTIYIERQQEESWPMGTTDYAKSVGDQGLGSGILQVAKNLEGEKNL